LAVPGAGRGHLWLEPTLLHLIADGQLWRILLFILPSSSEPGAAASSIAEAIRLPVRQREAMTTVPVVGR